ncbi:MAG: hypothetical protein ACTSYI_08805 [Promethearchaeota archaeon]
MVEIESYEEYSSRFYHIFDNTNNHPNQGDMYIKNFPDDPNQLGIIVVSNACDLEIRKKGRKLNFLSFLPIIKASEYFSSFNNKARNIIQQRTPDLFYLPPNPLLIDSLGGIVPIERLQTIEIDKFIKVFDNPDLGINSSYREKLNWCVSNLFSRIPNITPNEKIIKIAFK